MKILVVNPNTSTGVTERILATGRAVASPGTELIGLTAPRGVPYIATRAEAALGGAIVLEMVAEHAGDADAVVIAAFGDPGLAGVRELLSVPVVGLAEAAMLTACMLGRKFALVTFSRALAPWYRECVDYNGLARRLASIRLAEGSFGSIDGVQDEMADQIALAAERSAIEDDADVIVLAGAPLAGLADRIRHCVPLPIVDGVAAATKQAEALVALRPRKATVGAFRRPDPKPSIGLPDPVARLLACADLAR